MTAEWTCLACKSSEPMVPDDEAYGKVRKLPCRSCGGKMWERPNTHFTGMPISLPQPKTEPLAEGDLRIATSGLYDGLWHSRRFLIVVVVVILPMLCGSVYWMVRRADLAEQRRLDAVRDIQEEIRLQAEEDRFQREMDRIDENARRDQEEYRRRVERATESARRSNEHYDRQQEQRRRDLNDQIQRQIELDRLEQLLRKRK